MVLVFVIYSWLFRFSIFFSKSSRLVIYSKVMAVDRCKTIDLSLWSKKADSDAIWVYVVVDA